MKYNEKYKLSKPNPKINDENVIVCRPGYKKERDISFACRNDDGEGANITNFDSLEDYCKSFYYSDLSSLKNK